MTTTTDLPLKYDASGTVNTSEAWTDNSPPAVTGPWYDVPAQTPGPADGLGAHWKFSVRHSATQFKSGQATQARLWVKGEHIRVPAPNHGEGLNLLPEIGTEAKDVKTVKAVDVSVWGGLPHLGATPPHNDYYGVVGTGLSYSVIGATATLGGKVDVIGRHSESLPKEFKDWAKTAAGFASVSAASRPFGSAVSFDAATRMLLFHPGTIDVLDLQGGFSQGVDPQFSGDRLLGANLSISPLTLQGIEPDGRFRFSGGEVHVAGATGDIGLNASFDEYLLGDTSQREEFDSFGVLARGETNESLEVEMPTFLERFNADHVLQQHVSGNLEDRVLSLSFVTAPGLSLAQLTNGFTQSAAFVPADIIVGGMTHVAEPHHQLPGDYNRDGWVDTLDYQVWRAEFDMPAGLADGNGNGVTDAADYVMWREHAGIEPVAGAGSLAAAGIMVPEPSILILAVVGLCLTLSGRELRVAASSAARNQFRGTVRRTMPRTPGKPSIGPSKG